MGEIGKVSAKVKAAPPAGEFIVADLVLLVFPQAGILRGLHLRDTALEHDAVFSPMIAETIQ